MSIHIMKQTACQRLVLILNDERILTRKTVHIETFHDK
jgi:hypothetical protein